MKAKYIISTCALMLGAGCQSEDEMALERYTNIPPGSPIVLVTKANAKDYTSSPVREFELLLTNECALEEISDGALSVSNFEGKRLTFAGNMVKLIVVKEQSTPPEAVEK